ncbi:MAG: Elongation of fatty acids protein 2 [Marteilia pararefringens]
MIKEINLNKFLSDTKFSSAQFIDLCILLGCDYCQPIKKIGPTRAFSLLAKYRSIEAILENLESKYKAEEDWQYKKARELFENPNVDTSKQTFKWNSPDEEAIIEFLVKTKNFKSETVKNGVARLRKSINKPPQTRIDSFFKQSPAKLNKT